MENIALGSAARKPIRRREVGSRARSGRVRGLKSLDPAPIQPDPTFGFRTHGSLHMMPNMKVRLAIAIDSPGRLCTLPRPDRIRGSNPTEEVSNGNSGTSR